MKTEPTPKLSGQQQSVMGAAESTVSPLVPLLTRSADTAVSPTITAMPPSMQNGLVLAVLHDIDTFGTVYVDIAQLGLARVAARTMATLTQQDIGRQLVIGFENGQLDSPIVLGLLQQPAPMPTQMTAKVVSPQALLVEHNSQRTVIEAEQELELRCGEAVILLQADGRIQLRGQYITSHASAGQRIRGGSVQIN